MDTRRKERSFKDQPSTYKSVRFAKENSSPLHNSLNYSLTQESSFGSKKHSTKVNDSSKLSYSDLSTARRNLFPYTTKNKKVKRMQKASLSKSRDPNLPHEYYPIIKSPLRNKLNLSRRFSKKARKSSKKRNSRSRSRKSRSKLMSKSTLLNKQRSRTNSRSMSRGRRLVYSNIEDDFSKEDKPHRWQISTEDYEALSKSDARVLNFFLRELQALEHKLENAGIQLSNHSESRRPDTFTI
jgi:hypothetical protein